jgi:hypothetical protein
MLTSSVTAFTTLHSVAVHMCHKLRDNITFVTGSHYTQSRIPTWRPVSKSCPARPTVRQAPRERKYSSCSFLTSALDWVIGQCHAPATLYPQGKGPGARRIGGSVGLSWSTQRLREKFSASAEDRTPVVQSVVRHCTD